ncbi:MAG: trypsin-like peptidase domain-containing protein [Actinomycetota bacterium]|nr:trypsin-like peptidase domain-containing protein [Actinomycetota bacterium]
MNRISNLIFVLLGALSVGAVVAVLALTGALPDRVQRVETPAAASPAPATSSPVANPTANSVADIYQRVSPGVVFVSARGGGGSLPFDGPGGGRAASGSGFVIDEQGHIVTNDHVVENADRFSVRFGKAGDPIPAKLVGKDPSSDLAVLEIDPGKVKGGLKPLTLASSKGLRPGQATIAIGSPFGLAGTVTTGIVSALDREIQAPNGFSIPGAVQTDAAINPGNSGGPLLDAQGRVIGVNSQIATNGSDANSGVGFAVPADSVRQVIPRLVRDGKIERAYLGLASTEDPSRPGALVRTVNTGTPADRAGVRPGDLVVAISSTRVRNPSDLGKAVNAAKPGDTVTLQIRRGGDTRKLDVKLGTRPDAPVQ